MTANELDLAAAVEDGALQLEAMLAHLMREAIIGNQRQSETRPSGARGHARAPDEGGNQR